MDNNTTTPQPTRPPIPEHVLVFFGLDREARRAALAARLAQAPVTK